MHLIVMPDFFPLVPCWWLWHRCTIADVDDDIFGLDAVLQLAHLWVLATTLEKPRRLNLEVANGDPGPITRIASEWSEYSEGRGVVYRVKRVKGRMHVRCDALSAIHDGKAILLLQLFVLLFPFLRAQVSASEHQREQMGM